MNGEAVYRALEREIVLGRLKPRERLLEAELCRRLGVSRTLLREVFRRLEGTGLITLQPNRGVVVRDFAPQEVEDVYFLRTVLERAAVTLIIGRVRPPDMQELRQAQRAFEAACGQRDMAGMILTNLAFHRRLTEVSGNAFLCQALETSRLQTHLVRYVAWLDAQRVQESIRGHRTILAALARRNAATLEAAVLSHLEGGKGDYRRIFPVGGDGEHEARINGGRVSRGRRMARRKEDSHARQAERWMGAGRGGSGGVGRGDSGGARLPRETH